MEDIGDTYHSCVQCGYVMYGRAPATVEVTRQRQWRPRQPADRSTVRRRQIARARARARTAGDAVA
ncbi:MAG: hypothetical protein M0R73_09875 [Dehalococcoidia bacterium]|nr:hypothetical protein [Dehalococcoidia bacterium]